jgi:glycosyltransferase involved in cell wall biosynthesis
MNQEFELKVVSQESEVTNMSTSPTVSLVINTRNEEHNIAACIKSAGDFPDEVVVCDMYSTDGTREIAKGLGARVALHKPEPFVERARRFAVEQARGEWVLILDADERATPESLAELQGYVRRSDVNMVNIRFRFLFMGRLLEYTSGSVAWGNRLFRRAEYLKLARSDAEATLHSGYNRILTSMPLQAYAKKPFIHLAYATSAKYCYKTLYYYTYHEAVGRFEQGERATVGKLIWKPLRGFLSSYIWRQGFRDGIEGFIFSVLWAVYFFLVIGNLYDLQSGRTEDHKHFVRE